MKKILLGLTTAAVLSSSLFAYGEKDNEFYKASKINLEAGSLNGTGDARIGIDQVLIGGIFLMSDQFVLEAKISKENQAIAALNYQYHDLTNSGKHFFVEGGFGFEKFITNDLKDLDKQIFYSANAGIYLQDHILKTGYKIGSEKHEIHVKYESPEFFNHTTMSATIAQNYLKDSENFETTALIGVNYKF
ncbi:hypothetical protein [Aliarcobacter butzleri]|uniref:hypothetical protein n=1 Tax=Aliarcobacter butzleri TaxID=28197 RepID=UPI0021B33467|nr:hypothetical protein [Aliarcobacter butzleri]MCT7596098.1 hypothetical protein [Aliarcobacter butzleri]